MVSGLAAVGLLVLGAAPGPSAGPAVAGPPSATAEATASTSPKGVFLRWATELARAKKLSVCRAGQLQYPGEPSGYFAMLGRDEPHGQPDAIWVFGQGQVHWSFTRIQSAITVEECPASPPWEQHESVTVSSGGIGARYMWDNFDVTFVEGEPVILTEEHHDVDGSVNSDWLLATEHVVEHDQAEPEPTGKSDRGLLIAMLPGSRWIKTWKTPTFVPFGAKNRQNAGDADLAAYVVDRGKAGIQVVVDVTDDLPVPTAVRAPARKFIRSDHLEIWWRPYGASKNKQLGIGLLGDGTVDVRWLLPSQGSEGTPVVRRTGTHLEVDLSLATLGLEESAAPPNSELSVDFTVAFSDADDAGAGQQTVVATSPVLWNRQETFGRLIWLSSKARRFPSFASRLPP